jgi:hypothetical protein
VGDKVNEVYLEKQRLIKLLNSLKDTTPEITEFQCVLKERRGDAPQTSQK